MMMETRSQRSKKSFRLTLQLQITKFLFSAWKALQKKKKKTEEETGKKPVPTPGTGKKPVVDDDELDPSKYTENRKKFIQDIRDAGGNPYPHKFSRSHRIDQFREDFDG